MRLAEWLDDTPVIYYPFGLYAAAVRFKNSLQENAKKHAMIEDVIEACHNGIVAWEKDSNLKPILIRGSDDYIKTKERWNIIKEYSRDCIIAHIIVQRYFGQMRHFVLEISEFQRDEGLKSPGLIL